MNFYIITLNNLNLIIKLLISFFLMTQHYIKPLIMIAMEDMKYYISIVQQKFQKVVEIFQEQFLSWTQNIDFSIFCIFYAVFLIFVLRRLNKTEKFRPKNKQLISWKKYYKQAITGIFFSLPIIKQMIKKKINKGFKQLDQKIYQDLQSKRDQRKSHKLPLTGMNEQNLRRRIQEWYSKQSKHMQTGKISGALYIFDQEYYDQLNNFAAKYMYHNPLHLDTYKQLMRMQAQVLRMTGSLISQNPQQNAHGVITSGGSQSLIMALYAYKKYYKNRQKPNIVVPNSIHAAVDKGCYYFNIQVRKARLNDKYEVDLKHLESMIDSNTILIIGSYPNYPHGIIDPILQMAKLGVKYDIGVHIDGCLGGFVAAFDKQHQKVFNIDTAGITSVSLDHHKFGLAPKGISTIFFKTKQLRHSMYYINSQWCGGLYGTPSFCGSRHGFASAGAWYAMTRNTRKGYQQNTKLVLDATLKTAQKLRKIPGIKVFGQPKVCALAFSTENTSCFDLCSYLNKQKGYDISPIHLPNGIHISMTLANFQKILQNLANDIVQGFKFLQKNPPKESSTAAVYGASSSLPTSDIGDDFLKVIIGATLK